ncbi:MAG: DUF1552 domain-containing protein [Planctomycetota bacterium]
MIDRRTFLRGALGGAAASVALPWLEALAPRAEAAQDASRRLLFLFVPNGVHMEAWTPASEGAGFALTPLLEPLAKHKDDLLVLSGLTLDGARAHGDGPGDHARALGSFLTCCHPRKQGVFAGVSADQVAAGVLGRRTALPSLELGVEHSKSSGSCDSGYSCAYSSNLSWRGPTTPMGKEIDPRRVFERLFGQRLSPAERAERDADRKSVLDAVGADARALRGRLGRADRDRLDEYLTGVRELEARLQRQEGAPRDARLDAVRQGLPPSVPSDPREHLRLLSDLIALALASDQTRVVSFMLANAGSNKVYKAIGVRGGHHHLSHHGGDAEKRADIQKINRFHVEELAYLLDKLAAAREGEARLLDRVGLVYGSGIGDGNRHNHDELPILVAGGLGGALRGGRHLRYPKETPLANLYLALLREVGARAPRFGDSTGVLPGLGG